MQYAERYEIRITTEGEMAVRPLPDGTTEQEARSHYSIDQYRLRPGQSGRLVRISEVVLGADG